MQNLVIHRECEDIVEVLAKEAPEVISAFAIHMTDLVLRFRMLLTLERWNSQDQYSCLCHRISNIPYECIFVNSRNVLKNIHCKNTVE